MDILIVSPGSLQMCLDNVISKGGGGGWLVVPASNLIMGN